MKTLKPYLFIKVYLAPSHLGFGLFFGVYRF